MLKKDKNNHSFSRQRKSSDSMKGSQYFTLNASKKSDKKDVKIFLDNIKNINNSVIPSEEEFLISKKK